MKIWIHLNGVKEGPFLLEELPVHRMDGNTPVWYAGLADWTPAKDAPELANIFVFGGVPADDEQLKQPQPPRPPMPGQQPWGQRPPVPGSQPPRPPMPGPQPPRPPMPGQQPWGQRPPMPGPQPPRPPMPGQQPWGQRPPMPGPQPPRPPMPGQQPQRPPMPGPQPQQQRPTAPPPANKAPNVHAVLCILLFLLCCNILALVPLVLGLIARNKYSSGDLAGAKRLSEAAEWCLMIAIAIGFFAAPLTMMIFS